MTIATIIRVDDPAGLERAVYLATGSFPNPCNICNRPYTAAYSWGNSWRNTCQGCDDLYTDAGPSADRALNLMRAIHSISHAG